MKRLLTFGIWIGMALICAINALAVETPITVTFQNLNGVQQCAKVFTLPPDIDPGTLIEAPFEYGGLLYTFSDMTAQENRAQEGMSHTETITINSKSKELSAILELLSSTMEYDDGTYSGVLYLDHDSIHTEAAGYTNGSYTIREVKEISDLDCNDMSYVPATTTKDGRTLTLANVEWQGQGTALVEGSLVPSRYKAVATYTGSVPYRSATGYVTTANYVGTISRDEIRDITYTVIYVGSEGKVVKVKEETDAENTAYEAPEMNDGSMLVKALADHKIILSIGVFSLAALLASVILFIRSRHQVRAGIDEEDDRIAEESFEMEDNKHEE